LICAILSLLYNKYGRVSPDTDGIQGLITMKLTVRSCAVPAILEKQTLDPGDEHE